MSELRSRTTFRWMPAPVLSHNVKAPDELAHTGSAPSARTVGKRTESLSGAAFGRGLYGRKVARVAGTRAGTDQAGAESEPAPLALSRVPATLLRWQQPYRYLILWQRRDFTLTWHAPWCRQCDCPGAGWRFQREGGYASGLGFELSYAQE